MNANRPKASITSKTIARVLVLIVWVAGKPGAWVKLGEAEDESARSDVMFP
jgi:hypothetical protein